MCAPPLRVVAPGSSLTTWAHIVIALALRVFTAAITVVDSPTIRSVSPDPYLGKAVAVWGDGASYTGPGGVWLNREP